MHTCFNCGATMKPRPAGIYADVVAGVYTHATAHTCPTCGLRRIDDGHGPIWVLDGCRVPYPAEP